MKRITVQKTLQVIVNTGLIFTLLLTQIGSTVHASTILDEEPLQAREIRKNFPKKEFLETPSPIIKTPSTDPTPSATPTSSQTDFLNSNSETEPLLPAMDPGTTCPGNYCTFLPLIQFQPAQQTNEGPDLSIEKSDQDVSVQPGEVVSYTLTYQNYGFQDASGVVITENLPENSVFEATISSSGWLRVGETSQYQYNLGSLPASASGQLVFAIRCADQIPQGFSTLENQASIDDDHSHGIDPNSANNSAQDVTPIIHPSLFPDLSVTLSSDKNSVTPSGQITYTINYANNGTGPSSGIEIQEFLPTLVTFNPSQSSEGWQPGQNNEYTFWLGDLPANATGSLAFAVNIQAAIPDAITSIENSVTIKDDRSHGDDLNPADNSSAISTTLVAQPELEVSVSNDEIVVPGSNITFTTTYQNNGNQDAKAVLLQASLPPYSFFDASNSTAGWVQIGTSSDYQFSLGLLPAGSQGQASFSVSLMDRIPAGVETIFSSFVISDDGTNGLDPIPSNNSTLGSVQVNADPDLKLIMTNDSVYSQPGETLIYDLSYTNIGNQDAAGVLITEMLPENTIFSAEQSTNGWQQIGLTNQYQFIVGDLPVGNEIEIQFSITVSDNIPEGIISIIEFAEKSIKTGNEGCNFPI